MSNLTNIQNLLDDISQENNIKIIFASECGSRAYGLCSNTSDYDIRFIYIHKEKSKYHEYLELQRTHSKKKLSSIDVDYYDNIEQKTITGKKKTKRNKYDWHGWDITKAVQHLKEMNPSIVEWIYSPIVYVNDPNYNFLDKSKELLSSQNRILPMLQHYRSMARRHYEEYVKEKCQVRIKKYLVIVRCCGMIKWLLKCKRDDEIQIDFIEVLNDIKRITGNYLMDEINFLIEKKRESQDKYDCMNRIKALDSWISFYINDQGQNFEKIKQKECDIEEPDNAPYSRFIFKCINGRN